MLGFDTGERVPWSFGAPTAGKPAFSPGAKRFETGSVDAARQHFRDFSDGRIRLNFGTERDFCGVRHFRAEVGRTLIETFELDVSAPHEVLTVPPREAELFLFAPFKGALEIIQGPRRVERRAGPDHGHDAEGQRHAQALDGPERDDVHPHRPADHDEDAGRRIRADQRSRSSSSTRRSSSTWTSVPTFWNYVRTLWSDLNQERPCVADSITARSCERTLLLLTVQSFPNNLSTQLERMHAPASPYYVRRVEQYIRANAAQEITIAEMTEIAGVSARSLYYGFQRYLGMSPMKYLKRVRLDGARAALRDARRAHETVTRIALGAGYANLNRFCRDYRARFGETPSTTMRNG